MQVANTNVQDSVACSVVIHNQLELTHASPQNADNQDATNQSQRCRILTFPRLSKTGSWFLSALVFILWFGMSVNWYFVIEPLMKVQFAAGLVMLIAGFIIFAGNAYCFVNSVS